MEVLTREKKREFSGPGKAGGGGGGEERETQGISADSCPPKLELCVKSVIDLRSVCCLLFLWFQKPWLGSQILSVLRYGTAKE